jgi:RNA polymerase sigma-70 factor (ECF subfamily)
MAMTSSSARSVIEREPLPGADSDAELLCRIAERELWAFELLYRRYVRAVYAMALRRLRDGGHAEDATQEVFAAVWRSAATYTPERGGGARWLFTIARNEVIDYARAMRRVRDAPEEQVPERASGEPQPDLAVEGDWVSLCVHAAVAELPDRERVPVALAYWGGRSQSEIARLLGLPLGTVKTRTRSALARLAAGLEGTL